MRVSKFFVLVLAVVCAFGVAAPVAQATPSCSIHVAQTPFNNGGNLDGYWDFKCGPAPFYVDAYPLIESGGQWYPASCADSNPSCHHLWGYGSGFAGNTEHSHIDGWDTGPSVCGNRWKTHFAIFNWNTDNLFAEYSSPIFTC